MIKLIRSELLKIRTTNTWWIFSICAFLVTAAAFAIWVSVEHSELNLAPEENFGPGFPPEEAERIRAEQAAEAARQRSAIELARGAAQIYTSGQFFGLMFVMLIGILMVTNEFYHQTATATFLTTPKRTVVIVSKLITALAVGLLAWLATTALNVAGGVIFYSIENVTNSLGTWEVTRALLLNLLAYTLWTAIGIGIGVLLRSQIGATVTAALMYTLGTFLVLNVLGLLYATILEGRDWVLQSAVLLPAIASQHMITGIELGEDVTIWPRWAGAVVLIGYAVVFGVVGTLITRKRDIS